MKAAITCCLLGAFLPMTAATINVSPGQDLQAAMNSAAPGDTILVQAGTYRASGQPYGISKSLTVTASGAVTLLPPIGSVEPTLRVSASNVTVQGFTVTGGSWGITVHNQSGAALSNVVLRNLTVSTNSTGSNLGHGINLTRTSNSTIENCVVTRAYFIGIYVNDASHNVRILNTSVQATDVNAALLVDRSDAAYIRGGAYASTAPASQGVHLRTSRNSVIDGISADVTMNGILLDMGSTFNVIMNNTITRASTHHGIALQDSNSNVIVNNTILSGFHGILLLGSSFNRIERNNLDGYIYGAIVLSPNEADASLTSVNNYVARNRMISRGLAMGQSAGAGIWLNLESNGNYVFGNENLGVHPEGGIESFNSSKNYIRANTMGPDFSLGITLWDEQPSKPDPAYNYIQNNYVYDVPNNGAVLLRGADNAEIAYNFLSGTNGGAGDYAINLQGPAIGLPTPNRNIKIHSNTVLNFGTAVQLDPSTTGTEFFRNRFIESRTLFSIAPAAVKWDANIYFGGNYYSWFAASGNPSPTTPFQEFIDSPGGARRGLYKDAYPFQSEHLGKGYSVSIIAPVADLVAAAGSQKTIAWRSSGCVFVDLAYTSAAAGTVTFATNHPNVEYYHWKIPAGLPAASDYVIRVTCKNGAGAAAGVSAASSPFSIGASNLVLTAPGPDQMANPGPVRVAWKKDSSVGPVNVYLKYDSQPYSLVASNLSDTFTDINLPSVNSNRVSVMIQDASNPNKKDSVDGYFTIRAGAPRFTFPAAGSVLIIRDVVDLEWVSPQNAEYLDLDLWDQDVGIFRRIATDLPDRGVYRWLVTENWMAGGYLRATFKTSTGQVTSTVNSGTFDIQYTTTPGQWVPFYRLYSDVTKEHLYTTDAHERSVLAAIGLFIDEGTIGNVLNGPLTVGGERAKPYWRVYWKSPMQHLWTFDQNEYHVLRDLRDQFLGEHIVGYVFRNRVAGTCPVYRAVHRALPYHVWTNDKYEYDVITSPTGGWIAEGVAAYIQTTDPSAAGGYAGACTPGAPMPNSLAPVTKSVGTLAAAYRDTHPPAAGRPELAVRPLISPVPVKSAARPVIDSVANTASYIKGPIAAGQAVTILGENLGPEEAVSAEADAGSMARGELSGTRVRFDGLPVRLLFASKNELRVIASFEIRRPVVKVEVARGGLISDPVLVDVAGAAPGLFTSDFSGKGQAAALDENGQLNSPDNPAAPGSIVRLYATGLGELAASEQLDVLGRRVWKPVLPVSVFFGDQPAEMISVEPAGVPGVMEIKARLPDIVTAGVVAVRVSAGEADSQSGVMVVVGSRN